MIHFRCFFSVTLKRTLNLPLITSSKRYFSPPEIQQKKLQFRWESEFFLILLFQVAVRTGLEPVTPCVTGMYSNQLN